MTGLDIYGDPAGYYRCVDQFMWRLRPVVLDDDVQVGVAWSTVGWIVGLTACLILLHFIAARDATANQTGP
jgi:hypothetical protein